MTLNEEKKRLTDLNIGVCGDLKNGRTVHSLVRAAYKYGGNKFTLISAKELGLPDYIKRELGEYRECSSIEEALPNLDVLYMTRIQKERFAPDELEQADYETQKQAFILDAEKLKTAKPDLIIMHPLPRVDEIAGEVDSDPRAAYFKQANYGMYARMALILILLNYDFKSKPLLEGDNKEGLTCSNPRCIVNHESGLKNSFNEENGVKICEFCEKRQ